MSSWQPEYFRLQEAAVISYGQSGALCSSCVCCYWLLSLYMLDQTPACHSSTDHISCSLNPKLCTHTSQDAFCKSVLTHVIGLKKADHSWPLHNHVNCVCVYECVDNFTLSSFLYIQYVIMYIVAILNWTFYPLCLGSYDHFNVCIHAWCILHTCVIVHTACVCYKTLALEHISASLKSINTSIRSQQRNKLHLLLLSHSLFSLFLTFTAIRDRFKR